MRVPHDLEPTAWARARSARGAVPYDLTVSNPTLCDLPYPPSLLEPLRDPAALSYRPDPKGLLSAREAVAREYAVRGVRIDPDHVVLTASSSESYGFLFKLLCDPGDDGARTDPVVPAFFALGGARGRGGDHVPARRRCRLAAGCSRSPRGAPCSRCDPRASQQPDWLVGRRDRRGKARRLHRLRQDPPHRRRGVSRFPLWRRAPTQEPLRHGLPG